MFQVEGISMVDNDAPAKYSSEVIFYVEKYEIV